METGLYACIVLKVLGQIRNVQIFAYIVLLAGNFQTSEKMMAKNSLFRPEIRSVFIESCS